MPAGPGALGGLAAIGLLSGFIPSAAHAESLLDYDPPARIRRLFKNCVKNESGKLAGPGQVCYPEEKTAPSVSPKRDERLRGKLEQGVMLEEAGKTAQQVVRRVQSDCERKFLDELFQDGLLNSRTQAKLRAQSPLLYKDFVSLPEDDPRYPAREKKSEPMGWADAVIFSSGVTEPKLYINADPSGKLSGAKSGGLLVVLPKYEWCTDREKVLQDLREVNREWLELVRLADLDEKGTAALTRAMNDPQTVFEVIRRDNGCPDVQILDKSRAIQGAGAPLVASAPSQKLTLKGGLRNLQEAVKKAIGAMEDRDPDIAELVRYELEELQRKGIEVGVNDITVKGQKLKSSDLWSKAYPSHQDEYRESERKIAEKLGLDQSGLNRLRSVQVSLHMSYLMDYRKNHPEVTNRETYVFDPSGSGEVIKVGIADGFVYDEVLGMVVPESAGAATRSAYPMYGGPEFGMGSPSGGGMGTAIQGGFGSSAGSSF